MPIVRNLYRGLKQIFETVLSRRAGAFKTVALIEYPRKGIWSLVFVAADARGEISHRSTIPWPCSCRPRPTRPPASCSSSSAPNMIVLDMSVEDAAKMVISAGLVTPEFAAENARDLTREEIKRRFNPPSAA